MAGPVGRGGRHHEEVEHFKWWHFVMEMNGEGGRGDDHDELWEQLELGWRMLKDSDWKRARLVLLYMYATIRSTMQEAILSPPLLQQSQVIRRKDHEKWIEE